MAPLTISGAISAEFWGGTMIQASRFANQQTVSNPVLPEPQQYLVPPMHLAQVVGWKDGETPATPGGLKVTAMATGLEHPRSVYPLPNGDVMVVESRSPDLDPVSRPRTIVMKWVEALVASAGSSQGSNRITLLRDTHGDGRYDVRTVFIDRLYSPFGVALVGNDLYVANTDAILRFHYTPDGTSITEPGTMLTLLPGESHRGQQTGLYRQEAKRGHDGAEPRTAD